jgi:hypothetical protein
VSAIPAARPTVGLTGPKLAVGLNAGLAVAAAVLWAGMAWRGDFWRSDFSAFYTGWSIVRDGHAEHIYDLAWQTDVQGELLSERAGTDALLPYVSPPHFVVAAPLAYLPLPAAFYAWTALQAALLALTLRWLWRDARPWGPEAPAIAITTLLAFQPVFLTFQLGQLSLISLVALYGLARALRDDQQVAAGAWLALASLKPQLALLPAVFLLGAYRWRVLLIAGGIFAVWAGVATAVLGWRCWPDFLTLTEFHAQQFGTFGIFPLRGHNLKMLFTALLGPDRRPLINTLTGIGLLLAAGMSLVLGYLSRKADLSGRERCFALMALLGVLAAPHLNPHDALLLVVPVVLLYDARFRAGEPTRALAAVLVACPLLFLADSYAMDWWPSLVRPFFLVIVALTIWAARDLARQRSSNTAVVTDH